MWKTNKHEAKMNVFHLPKVFIFAASPVHEILTLAGMAKIKAIEAQRRIQKILHEYFWNGMWWARNERVRFCHYNNEMK